MPEKYNATVGWLKDLLDDIDDDVILFAERPSEHTDGPITVDIIGVQVHFGIAGTDSVTLTVD